MISELETLQEQIELTERSLPVVSMSAAVDEASLRYEELFGTPNGLVTGMEEFDEDTGGLKKGNLIVIAAETNVGKSTFALNIVNNVVNAKKSVALFSLEMDRGEIVDLLFSMNAGVNRNVFNTGKFTNGDSQKLVAYSPLLKGFPLYIFDEPNVTVEDIRATSLALKAERDLSLIVVDYLQLVSATVFRESREQQVAAIGRGLKALAKECKCPLIAISQLNEDGKIRESRAIAHDAHIVFMLNHGEDGTFWAKITKGRSIPKKSYCFAFNAPFCKLSPTAKRSEEPHEHPNGRKRRNRALRPVSARRILFHHSYRNEAA